MNFDEEVLNAELGNTNTLFHAGRINELNLAHYRMFAQARRSICFFSYNLDPRILSDRNIEKASVELVRRSRYSNIRILVFDVSGLTRSDHRLVSVAQKFSSYVSIRVLSRDYQQLPYCFNLVDDCGFTYRQHHDDLDSQICFNNKLKVKELQKQFDDMWEVSRVASELRTLGL